MTATHIDTAALASTMVEQGEAYRSLLALSVSEEHAIVGGDVEQLTELIGEKERMLELLAALETERMTALTSIVLGIRRDPPTITLSEVARHAEPSAAETLMEAGMVLRAQAVALQQANERNSKLLEGSRALIERWVQYLRAVVAGSLTYTAEGEPNDRDGTRVLDRSA